MTGALTGNGLFGRHLADPDMARTFSARAFLRHMLAFERAWTVGLAELGAVERALAEQAIRVIEETDLDLDDLAAGAERDGLPVPAMVRALKAKAGDAAGAVHLGATSQDVIDTAMVMSLRALAAELGDRLDNGLGLLSDLAARYGNAQMMGRTRMQAALPIPVSARVDAWTRPLTDARSRLEAAADALPVQIGGAVGLRDQPTGMGERMAEIVARELALPMAPVWHTARAPVVDFGHALVLVTGALGKIGHDIALMAQQGVDEVRISGGGGSSAMPHKQNPVAAEAMVTLARYVAGQQGILAQALAHEQERSGICWALEWLTLPAMAEATGAATRHATTLLSGIERLGPGPAPDDT